MGGVRWGPYHLLEMLDLEKKKIICLMSGYYVFTDSLDKNLKLTSLQKIIKQLNHGISTGLVYLKVIYIACGCFSGKFITWTVMRIGGMSPGKDWTKTCSSFSC